MPKQDGLEAIAAGSCTKNNKHENSPHIGLRSFRLLARFRLWRFREGVSRLLPSRQLLSNAHTLGLLLYVRGIIDGGRLLTCSGRLVLVVEVNFSKAMTP